MELDHGTGGDGEPGNGWRWAGGEKGWTERLLERKVEGIQHGWLEMDKAKAGWKYYRKG
jgi:hypothetical protein